MKAIDTLTDADPYFAGSAGFIGASLNDLHADMVKLELPAAVPTNIRRVHDAVRHAYLYSYYSYDLLTLAAAEAFPCLEFALRERLASLGIPVTNSKSGRLLRLSDLLKLARTNNLIRSEIDYIARMRNMFAHGSDAILNPPMVLTTLQLVTGVIAEMFSLPCHEPGIAILSPHATKPQRP
jgi:hypothetical protein